MEANTLTFFLFVLYWAWNIASESSDLFEILKNNGIFPYSNIFHMTSQKKHPVPLLCDLVNLES